MYMIEPEDMFLFASNTGEFYRDFCAAARRAPDYGWWFKFVRETAIPLYRKQCHQPDATMGETALMISAYALAGYYAEHVNEG